MYACGAGEDKDAKQWKTGRPTRLPFSIEYIMTLAEKKRKEIIIEKKWLNILLTITGTVATVIFRNALCHFSKR